MKLFPNGVFELGKVITPRVGVRHELAYQAPNFLNGIQPGGIGWQGNYGYIRMALEEVLQPRMKMVRPVIPHNVDPAGFLIMTRHFLQTSAKARNRHAAAIKGQDLAFNGIQETHHTHPGIGAVTVPHLRLLSPHIGPKPPLAWLPVETGLVLEQHYYLSRVNSGFVESLVQSPFFSSYRGSGL